VAEYVCRVAMPTGEVLEKVYVSDDEGSLRRQLENQDVLLLDMRRRSAALRSVLGLFRLRGGVSSREFLFFNKELRALLRAGLPIVPSLDILIERRKNKTFRAALVDIRDRVKSGEALSEAFRAQSGLFPQLYAASLASGERSGELAQVLERFVTYLHKMITIRRKVVSALIYPAVLSSLMGALICLMVFYIIPKFNEFLKDFGTELPLITRAVMGTSLFAAHNWLLIVVAAVGSVVALSAWNRTTAGRLVLDRIKLGLPLVGRVMGDYAQNRFTRTLGTLQAGGIPLVTSLDLSSRAVGNLVFENALLQVTEKVREGQSLWESLEATGLMSDITLQMVKVGESTGALDEMLQQASDFMDEEISSRLERLLALFEPLMLVVMAVVVAIMLLSIYYPLIQVYGQHTS
jgi:type IV pilus assembly protein PilC